jgi:hypothetical protein
VTLSKYTEVSPVLVGDLLERSVYESCTEAVVVLIALIGPYSKSAFTWSLCPKYDMLPFFVLVQKLSLDLLLSAVLIVLEESEAPRSGVMKVTSAQPLSPL